MEAINPNDIAKLNTDDISCITLKNGKMVMIDESAPEKFNNKPSNKNNNILNNDKKFEKLLISKHNILYFEGMNNFNKLNLEKTNSRYAIKNNQNIFKNDFNVISNISRNINFYFKPNKTLSSNNKDLNNEEEKIDRNMKGKSRNYFDKMNTITDERFEQQKSNDMISFSIHSDLFKHYNSTQKTFISLATQLRQKRNKYSSNIKDKSSYQRYYELYQNKDFNNKLLKNLNINRIQHYQKPEKENTAKNILDKYQINNNILDYNFNNNSIIFSTGLNDSNINNRTISTTSFYGAKTRASSENRIINNKLRSGMIGYSSTLIYPTNIFKSKLD
jgi:hypothetical protein